MSYRQNWVNLEYVYNHFPDPSNHYHLITTTSNFISTTSILYYYLEIMCLKMKLSVWWVPEARMMEQPINLKVCAWKWKHSCGEYRKLGWWNSPFTANRWLFRVTWLPRIYGTARVDEAGTFLINWYFYVDMTAKISLLKLERI